MTTPVTRVSRATFWKTHVAFASQSDRYAENICLICVHPLDYARVPTDIGNVGHVCPANPAIRLTPCGHIFCSQCMLTWTSTGSTCPTCRAKLFDPGLGPDAHAPAEHLPPAIAAPPTSASTLNAAGSIASATTTSTVAPPLPTLGLHPLANSIESAPAFEQFLVDATAFDDPTFLYFCIDVAMAYFYFLLDWYMSGLPVS